MKRLLNIMKEDHRKALYLIDGLDEYRIHYDISEYAKSQISDFYGGDDDDATGDENELIISGHLELIKLLDIFKATGHAKFRAASCQFSIRILRNSLKSDCRTGLILPLNDISRLD